MAEFNANKSLGADIKDPVLRLAQIYIGYNLLGQCSCVSKISLTELYFMRKMQKGESVNLAFWLAYQAHQINRSKTRHLNLCHIVGVYLRNNMDLIYARKGLHMEMCMSPRPFNLSFLLEHQIVRVLEGDHMFYEPGHVTPKTRNRANPTQVQGDKDKAKAGDKYSLEWLIDEVHDQRSQIDKIHTMVAEIWGALKRVRARQENAEGGSKLAETEVVEPEAMEEDKEEEAVNDEGQDAGDHEENGANNPTEAEEDEKESEDETARLVQLAVQVVLLSQKQSKKKEAKPKEKKSVPGDKKNPRKRDHPSQGSPS